MPNLLARARALAVAALVALATPACSPGVGSEAWCEQMKETPKGDWTVTEAADFAKHCVLR